MAVISHGRYLNFYDAPISVKNIPTFFRFILENYRSIFAILSDIPVLSLVKELNRPQYHAFSIVYNCGNRLKSFLLNKRVVIFYRSR